MKNLFYKSKKFLKFVLARLEHLDFKITSYFYGIFFSFAKKSITKASVIYLKIKLPDFIFYTAPGSKISS